MSRNSFTIEWEKKNHPKAVDTFYKCPDFYGDRGWRGGGGGVRAKAGSGAETFKVQQGIIFTVSKLSQ